MAAANATVPEEGLNVKALRERVVVTELGNESKESVWPETKGNQKIVQHVVSWGGHNQIVGSAGTSVMVAKALGL